MNEESTSEDLIKVFNISLKYDGGEDATNSQIDLYDLSTALNGFHRSLALTSHLYFHEEIITRAPSARGIKIVSSPPVEGSFEIIATLLVAGLYKVSTAPKDTPLGHLVSSLYELAIFKCTGQPLDYSTTIFHRQIKDRFNNSQIESLSQKLESSVKNMHRPILTHSAKRSQIAVNDKSRLTFDSKTLDLTNKLTIDSDPSMFGGRVAGYSANTRSGMIYSVEEKRAIPFELERNAQVDSSILSESLGLYDTVKSRGIKKAKSGFFNFMAKRAINQTGVTKKYYITFIYSESLLKIEKELTRP